MIQNKEWDLNTSKFLGDCFLLNNPKIDTTNNTIYENLNIVNMTETYMKGISVSQELGYLICETYFKQSELGAEQTGHYSFLPFSLIDNLFKTYGNELIKESHQQVLKFNDKIPVLAIHSPYIVDKNDNIIEYLASYNSELKKYEKRPVTSSMFSIKIKEDNLSLYKELIKKVKKRVVNQKERQLENDLYIWLSLKGIVTEKQIITSANHRLDLWIPGKFMLELKAGKVNGNDICQAMDYAATYKTSILIVGSGMTTFASRGLDAFNKFNTENPLIFITWSGVKDYLTYKLSL